MDYERMTDCFKPVGFSLKPTLWPGCAGMNVLIVFLVAKTVPLIVILPGPVQMPVTPDSTITAPGRQIRADSFGIVTEDGKRRIVPLAPGDRDKAEEVRAFEN